MLFSRHSLMSSRMARKHAIRCMVAISRIFWRQFGMPLFIYGLFQDFDKALKACW